uniref:Nodulin-related protein 1 n=1 Tax=Quercus lobata TaxID=97700 RepID=A0A7N2LBP2_QUELO
MNFLSDLQKKSNSSSEIHLPEEKNDQNQNQHQHHQPSNAELMASAKLLAEAGQTTISQGADKVDKARVAGAAGDLLGAASSYGKLEEKSYGKYVEKAETYLDQYGNPSSQSQSQSQSQSHSTTTDSEPHSAAAGGDHESEGNTESGTGDYVKMAQGSTNWILGNLKRAFGLQNMKDMLDNVQENQYISGRRRSGSG